MLIMSVLVIAGFDIYNKNANDNSHYFAIISYLATFTNSKKYVKFGKSPSDPLALRLMTR